MTGDAYTHPDVLVDDTWLAAHAGDADLRVYECTVYLRPPEPGSGDSFRIESGHADYAAGHIPGADFLDLQGELSDTDSRLRFMLPPAEHFAAAMARHGLGDGMRCVLYSRGSIMWATRLWWMLRAFGFDSAAVLDGGFETWRDAGRPLSTAAADYPPAHFTPAPRDGLFVDRHQVQDAIGADGVCTVNALLPDVHRGDSDRYGRPGRIAGSVNVPYAELIDSETGRLVDAPTARRHFAEAGATPDKTIYTYCGGGIAATLDAFQLFRLGFTDVAVYDASLSEWATDASLPMETG